MCQKHHRHSIQCILPPYMSSQLSKSSDQSAEQLKKDNLFRLKRRIIAEVAPKKRMMAMTAAVKSPQKLYREVYDAGQMPMTLGKLLWKEGMKFPATDKDLKNVIKGAGYVWNFYKTLFKRNSINNSGMPIIQTIRFRENPFEPYYNAFWDGEQMFYGTGDPKLTNSFTADLDIIGHELTHGVIDFEARFEYEKQSGALNESFADVFGILIKQWANKTPAKKSDWLVGANVLKGKNALRSLKAPGSAYKNDPIFGNDPQPAVMKDFVKLPNTEAGDWGGVHYNSGIPNFAFYVSSFEAGGNAWDTTGRVWYEALTDKKLLKPNSTFTDTAKVTLTKARALFGKGSLIEKAVMKGWKESGVI